MPRRFPNVPALSALVLLLTFAVCPSVRAQGLAPGGFDPAQIEEMTASSRQVPLTKEKIDRLIASFPDMRKTGAEFPGTELPDEPSEGGQTSDLDAMPADKRAALEAVAKKHGFKDLQEWTDVANSVVMSYVYAAQGKKPGSVEEAVRMNVASAEQDPNLTPEQREQTVALYRKMGETLQRLEPSKENYALVVEMKDKLAPVMDPN